MTSLTPDAFAAISAIEGLKLSEESRKRIEALLANKELSPAQRRAEVLRHYRDLAAKQS